MMGQTLPLLQASGKMMLRSRGVIFAVGAATVQVAVFGLMKSLDFGFGTRSIDFFDFALPGIAVFLVMFQLQDITVAVASSYKARGTLRRLAVTPVSPILVIATQILTYVVLGIAAAAVVLTVGKLMGGHLAMTPNLLWLVPLIGMAVLTALAIAFAVAGLTPNPQTASNVGVTISFLLWALTGAVIPIQALPGALPDIVPYAVPQTALIEAIRGIALTGTGITRYGSQVLVGVGWLAVALVVAAIAYRFTDE
ncbi:MAG TPA: ABC transporter permease [Actinomycetota bacterium]|jgi:ABC-2 type transport system permease protein|nr:ABC transporter permease [Actinomycetota bacterium]